MGNHDIESRPHRQWRLLRLVAPKRGGGEADVEMVRSLTWLFLQWQAGRAVPDPADRAEPVEAVEPDGSARAGDRPSGRSKWGNIAIKNGGFVVYQDLEEWQPLELNASDAEFLHKNPQQAHQVARVANERLELVNMTRRGYLGWLLTQPQFLDEHDNSSMNTMLCGIVSGTMFVSKGSLNLFAWQVHWRTQVVRLIPNGLRESASSRPAGDCSR